MSRRTSRYEHDRNMSFNSFQDFRLNELLLRALREESYAEPTEIQRAAIPEILARRDVLATAQTGTGKTAAFSLPMLEILHGGKGHGLRALVLTPTRELALQVEDSLRTYGRHLRLRSTVVVGGVAMKPQIGALRKHPDILVATPGRLLDLLGQEHLSLRGIEILVLDEADRMLDMGFVRDVQKIVSETPITRQTLFFSATMSPEIDNLARRMLRNPVRLAMTPSASVACNIDQKVLFVDQRDKDLLLVDRLKQSGVRRALVFTRTKHRADRVMWQLSSAGISAGVMHSDKTQHERQCTLAEFEMGRIAVMVATDIVARGIDVEGISHVINYELPNDPESYVHRVGRTARAGAPGAALSFCDASEVFMLAGIEKLIQSKLTAFEQHPFHSATVASLHSPRSGASARPVQWRSFGPGGHSRGRFR
jgi:ATP-dependent RNA helicase RhlE